MGAKVKKLSVQQQKLALKEESQVLFLLGEEEKAREVGNNFYRGLNSLWNALFYAKVSRQIEPGKFEDARRNDDAYFFTGGTV